MKMAKIFCSIAALLTLLVFFTGAHGTQLAVVNHTHIVSEGQTVWDVASLYMSEQDKTRDVRELVYDISKTNNIKNAYIYPGQVLTIPLGKRVDK